MVVLSILVVNDDKNRNLPNINVIYQAPGVVESLSLSTYILPPKKKERWLQNIPNNCQSVRAVVWSSQAWAFKIISFERSGQAPVGRDFDFFSYFYSD